ncbi:MAG: hypothetical protein MJZ11_11390 [Lachnospiraceae bacterium]|nr:hypothetical protein [Lachnospiraceae bacterium]
MKSKRLLLLRIMNKATSLSNKYKHSKQGKRGDVIGNYVGFGILYLFLIILVGAQSIGFALIGMYNAIPELCALVISIIAFFFTLIKAGGYLFGFKEYDMLMSMPFSVKDIVASKFLYMYLKTLPWFVSVSIAMLIGFAVGGSINIISIILWLVLSLIVPIIPMVLASLISFLAVKIGAGRKHKQVVQAFLTIVILLPIMFSNYFMNHFTENKSLQDISEITSGYIGKISGYYPPAKWFEKSIMDKDIVSILLLICITIVIFELFFSLVAKYFKQINTNLKNGVKSKKATSLEIKKKSMVVSIAYKEFKRLTGSSIYLTNIFIGQVISVIAGVAVLIIGLDRAVEVVLEGAPLNKEMLIPAIPFVTYLFVGMVASTCCSPSLEGKNYWIIKSMPIDPLADCKGKMLFNMFLSAPFGIFFVLCIDISGKFSAVTILLGIIAVTAMCMFSTTYGLVCGLKHRKLDWDNEVEVVKQGRAVLVYLLPNLFLTLILMVVSVVVGIAIGTELTVVGVIVLYLLLSLWAYHGVKKYANKPARDF